MGKKIFATKNTFCCSAFKRLFPFYKSSFFLFLFVGMLNEGSKLLWLPPHSFIQMSRAPLGPFCIISQFKGFGHSWIYLFLYLRLFCKRPHFEALSLLFKVFRSSPSLFLPHSNTILRPFLVFSPLFKESWAIHVSNHYLILSYYSKKSFISFLAFPILKWFELVLGQNASPCFLIL